MCQDNDLYVLGIENNEDIFWKEQELEGSCLGLEDRRIEGSVLKETSWDPRQGS